MCVSMIGPNWVLTPSFQRHHLGYGSQGRTGSGKGFQALVFKTWRRIPQGCHDCRRWSNSGIVYSLTLLIIKSEDIWGVSIVAKENLPPNATVVSCPFSLVISQSLARCALSSLIDVHADNWTERQWISTYLCFHWIIARNAR